MKKNRGRMKNFKKPKLNEKTPNSKRAILRKNYTCNSTISSVSKDKTTPKQ